MVKAVIFDFDGVITDENLRMTVRTLKQLLGENGISLEDRNFYLLEGAGVRTIIAELMGRPNNDPKVVEIDRKVVEKHRQQRGRIKAWPEPLQLAKKLKEKGVKVGIASGARRESIEAILGPELAVFDEVTPVEDVKKAKPDPELYVLSARKLGVKPSECVAIENAPRGITAAKKAGMTCIAITTTLGKEDLGEADYVVSNFQELDEKIRELRESTS